MGVRSGKGRRRWKGSGKVEKEGRKVGRKEGGKRGSLMKEWVERW